MGRKKTEDAEKINIIKEVTKTRGASPRLISVWLNVKYTTVSSWNSNTSQPNEENLNEIGELLEVDNRILKVPQGRTYTGLSKALEAEMKRLTKEEKIPFEIATEDEETGKTVKANNPELREKLKKFAEWYLKNHSQLNSTLFIDKYYKDIQDNENNDKSIFICKAVPQEGLPYFEYLIVNESLGHDKFIARFARKEDAEAYVKWLENEIEKLY